MSRSRFTYRNLSFAALFAAGALLAAPAPVLAQDDDADSAVEVDEGDTDAVDAGDVEETATGRPVPADAQSLLDSPQGPFPRISDNQETIYAVQRKAFLVEGKHELTPLFSASFSDRYVQTFGFGASYVYHLGENFGVEAYGHYMLPDASAFTDELFERSKLRTEFARLTQMLWTAGLGVQWSPIYGKVEIFDEYLGNFAFYLGLGVGIGETRTQCDSVAPDPQTGSVDKQLDPNRGFPTNDLGQAVCNPNRLEDDTFFEPNILRPMGAISGGVRFHFSTWLALKFEVKNHVFVVRTFRPGDDPALTDTVRSNVFAQLGVSFLLGGDAD